jgi:hypothetical protein
MHVLRALLMWLPDRAIVRQELVALTSHGEVTHTGAA